MNVRQLDPGAIERDLDNLWARMTEVSSGEGREAVIRACTLNLVVFGSSAGEGPEISRVVAEVTTEHPGRVLVILPTSQPGKKGMEAAATAQCHRPGRTDRQICCEQIVITSDEEQLDRVPSLVRPLLVSDLPVCLWWRDRLDSRPGLLDDLSESADRILVDSSRLPDQDFTAVHSLIQNTASWASVSDLGWSALTPWRGLLAGFFDSPDFIPSLRRISRVEVVCGGNSGDEIPTRASLLAAWLASALGWRPSGRPARREERRNEWYLTGEHHPVSIVTELQGGALPRGSLGSLKLVTGEDPAREFSATADAGGGYLEGRIRQGEKLMARRLVCLPERTESSLVAEELETSSRDPVYGRSVEFLAALQGMR